MEDRNQQRVGVIYGLAAYLWWGFIAVYFKVTAAISPLEILAHRIVWSLLLLLLLIGLRGRLGEFRSVLRDRRTLLTLCGTTLLIALNWLLFIWAVGSGRLVQASLGYFMNPLVNVLLGFVFLRERLRPLQTVAVLLALVGILWLTFGYGKPPLISLTLAFSFAFYGLLRKRVRASGVQGLAAETLLLAPAAILWMLWRARHGELAFAHRGWDLSLLLMAAGPITALPLVWFAEGARRLRLATMGFLQYVTPSLQLLLAVAAFGESFTRDHAVSFGLIWTALALYTTDTVRGLSRERALRRRLPARP